MASEVLEAIIDRSWTMLPMARQVVSALKHDPSASVSAGDLGRRLFPLAAGFKSCGQPILGRIVLGLAGACTELSLQNLTRSDQTFDLLQTALNEFGDLLVELDATGQITILEPTETISLLEAMVSHVRTAAPETILSEPASPDVQPDPLTELHRCGDALVWASESLLNRVQRDEASPYSTPVSRIHHLASTLRERLAEITPSLPAANTRAFEPTANVLGDDGHLVPRESQVIECLTTVECATASESAEKQCCARVDLEEHCFSADSEAVARGSIRRSPRVLVIDESPFFRMLLGTAVESSGQTALVLPSLNEAEASLNECQASDIVIWGGVGSSTETECLTDWIVRRDGSRRPMLIGLVNGTQNLGDVRPEFDHLVPRTHLTELLGIIRGKLGDATHAIKKIA